ncbi:PorP/SprF family type IX secretion system membrane protein [Algoriphagus sp. PAP.12]|uniref:PorP/SprF family type IX secretion system membrane protein n=1 Tax=Algoriphagus sp. PAP.12 TaxID=2996678 RepID=UPI00227B9CBB|nr:PorP/SprF family type IX secretion system membrane protein [Algoriphagus sp. PAP.12]
MRRFGIIICQLLLVFLVPKLGFSQQSPLFSEYNYVPFYINPAFAGLTYGPEISISNHGFIRAIEGSPKTYSLGFNAPLEMQNIGVGAVIRRDKIGVTTSTNAYAALSYKINFGAGNNRSYMRTPYWRAYNQKVFSFGMTAGFQQYEENLLELGLDGDPEFSENLRASSPTIGVGFLYNTADFFIGLSSPNLLSGFVAKDSNINLSNPIYGYIGYKYLFGNFSPMMLKPSLLLKYENGAPMQLDTNLSLSIADKFEIGAGYRSTSSINFMAGVYALNHLRLIYQHNAGVKNSFLGNSHGVTLTYFFNGIEQ